MRRIEPADGRTGDDAADTYLFVVVTAVLVALPFPLRLGALGLATARSATVSEILALALIPLWLAAEARRGALRRMVQSSLHLPALVLLAWTAAAAAAAAVDSAAAFRQAARLLTAVVLYLAMLRTLRSPRRLTIAAAALALPAIPVALIGIAERFLARDSVAFLGVFARRTGFLPAAQVIRAQATFVHPNVLAQYLEATLVLVAGLWVLAAATVSEPKRRRVDLAGAVAVAVLAAALAYTYSRAGLAGAGAGLGALAVCLATLPPPHRHTRRAAASAAVAATIVLAIGATDGALRQRVHGAGGPPPAGPLRIELWRSALETIAANPLLGVGPDNFRSVGPAAATPVTSSRHSHSLYLEAALDAGLPGLAALVWLFAAVWKQVAAGAGASGNGPEALLTCAAGATLLTFLLHGLVDLVVRQHSLLSLLFAIAALAAAAARLAAKPR